MRNGYFTTLVSLSICIAAIVGFNLLGGVITLAVYGMDVKNADPAGLILINGFSQIVVFIGMPLLLCKGLHIPVRETMHLFRPNKGHIVLFLLAIPLTISALLFGSVLSSIWMDFLSLFPDMYSQLLEIQKLMDDMMAQLVRIETPFELFIMLIGVALIPAITEEFFFRGFLFTNIERSGENMRTAMAVMVTSLAFGASHISPFNLPGLAFLGALFAWMMVTSRTIYIGMFGHFFNNALIVVILYIFHNDKQLSQSLTGTTSIPPAQSLPILLVSAGALYWLAKVFDKRAKQLTIEST
jgi:membrane protease YdiL (CAAX protease family)